MIKIHHRLAAAWLMPIFIVLPFQFEAVWYRYGWYCLAGMVTALSSYVFGFGSSVIVLIDGTFYQRIASIPCFLGYLALMTVAFLKH